MKFVQLYRSIGFGVCATSIAALASSCSVLAQGGSTQNSTPAATQSTQASLNAVDRQFIPKAAQSDLTEIKTSQLALQRSRDPKVKQFAQMMITQHTQSSNKLKPIAAEKRVTLPTSVGAENAALVSQLTKLSGTQFDQAYMKGQVQSHAKTQALYQKELKQGQDPNVKAFASQVLPIVSEHLRMAENIVAAR